MSSTFTEGLLHFILQKKDRLAPEHSRDGPGVISVLTGSPAVANRGSEEAALSGKKLTIQMLTSYSPTVQCFNFAGTCAEVLLYPSSEAEVLFWRFSCK